MSSINGSPLRHHPSHSSRPIGVRPDMQYPRQPLSTTPPYTSADELRPSPSQSRPIMQPRQSYHYFPASSWMDPPHPAPAPIGYPPSQFGTPSSQPTDNFNYYVNTYPAYTQPSFPTPIKSIDPTPAEDTETETEPTQFTFKINESESSKFVKPPPRPPNAWIIYRSDMLRAIARGDHMPKLEAAMAESGISSGEASQDDGMIDSSDKNAESGAVKPKPKKKVKKPKKGSKTPTAGMLSLGKGKTGRGIPQADVSKLISLMWAREDAEVKQKYERQSAVQKRQHQEKYPGYKFQPLKRAEKLRLREEKEREKAEAKEQKVAERQAERSAGLPGPKRKARSKAPNKSPYAAAMARTKSGSTPEGKDETSYTMYPFPFPSDSLPSLQGGAVDPAPEPEQPIESMPPPLPTYSQWADMPDLTSAYAVPYIFEPIPIPGEEFNLDLLAPLGDDADADALAALWCSVEEDVEGDTAGWDMTSSEAMQAWSELGSFPQYPAIQLSSSVAEQIAQDWTASLPPTYGAQPQSLYDPTLDMIQIPYYESPYTNVPGTSAPGSYEYTPSNTGAFLSADQPLSPVEPWTSQSLPDPMPFRHVSTGSNRLASSSYTPEGYLSPEQAIPRHVSSSAFPSASTMDPGGWTDRSVSFSAFGANLTAEADDLWGDEGDVGKGVSSGPSPLSQGTSVDLGLSSISNTPDSDRLPGPPRGVRRGRTVGAKYDEVI